MKDVVMPKEGPAPRRAKKRGAWEVGEHARGSPEAGIVVVLRRLSGW